MMCLTTVNDTRTCPQKFMTLYELTTLEKLNEAFYECSKISHWKESTQRYKLNLLINNIELQYDLRHGCYIISPGIIFTIDERGKLRRINAPVMRDRVVQKVLCKYILVPQLTKYFIYDNYASIKNRGTSFARKRIDIMLRRYMKEHGNAGYILKIDIKKYFESIDHKILKKMVHDKIREPSEVMNLIDYIIDTSSSSGKGLNLGAEAPQILAMFYLTPLDTYIKTILGVKYYGRYVDDIIFISSSKEELKNLLDVTIIQLSKLNLHINEKKTYITTLKHGFTYLQIKYHVNNGKIIKRPTHDKVVRERRRLKKYKELYDIGIFSELDIHNFYKSWRNSVTKDCTYSKRTIESMDSLYKSLFPVQEVYKRPTRDELIYYIYKEIPHGS